MLLLSPVMEGNMGIASPGDNKGTNVTLEPNLNSIVITNLDLAQTFRVTSGQ